MHDEDWYLHYGLDRDPFAAGGVQGLFYPGGTRQETVEQLQHLARFGDSVLLVTGAPGAGKSATLAHFVAQCAPDTRCAVVEVALLDGPEQILRRILAAFDIESGPAADLHHDLQQLERFCDRCRSEGLLTWLVFDDAQHLHEDAISLLAPLLEHTSARLRLVFFAEPQWGSAFRAALPAAATLHVMELPPLDRGETYAYMHYRMKTAGLEAEPPFRPEELEQIHQHSGGLPGRINAQARQVLIDMLGAAQQPLATLPVWHFGVVAATLLALVLLYAWSALDGERAEELEPRPGAALETGSDPVIITEEPAPAEDAATVAATDAASASAGAEATQEAVPGAATAEAETAPEQAEAEASPAPPSPPESAPVPVAASKPPVPMPPRAEPAREPRPATTEVTGPPAAPAAAPPATLSGTSADEQYLLGLAPSVYVLQIMGADDPARLRRVAARHSLSVRQYRKLHQGKPWYALVHGEFRDRASAERAARELAPRIGTQPWVRRVDAVQREIRQAQGR